ncbi:hypothetical protein Ddye_006368 [Dipteronia dyeriana]|uniref:RNase H type-1 domain-containing protein n=1 Tax=Dipteronia dyeriana TaxID=168575 RepID=A0AAD9XHX5_9ROSI|nr:hypothetical protein Ddye_006368 [Dipteronia dyeriana]
MVKAGNGKDGRDGDRVDIHLWKPSPAGSLKINIDATVNGNGKGSEALAILEGCCLDINRSLMPAVLESDALVLVQAICKREAIFSEVGIVVDDILLLFNRLDINSVNFVPRLTSIAAHGLAKYVLSFEDEALWVGDCPVCVENLIMVDALKLP